MSSSKDIALKELNMEIIAVTEQLVKFWGSAEGWAPIEAASLLSISRLDWQLSLTKQLNCFFNPKSRREEGALILGWTTLGSLVEGLMKLHLSVYFIKYKEDNNALKNKSGDLIIPDKLGFEQLKNFFRTKVFIEHEGLGEKWDWIKWIEKIQWRRNAIHAFKDRDIGNFDEFYNDLYLYYEFIKLIDAMLPYPDGNCDYR
jgi:hypothetical protein